MEKLFGFALKQECVGVCVWDCLCCVDWGHGSQSQISDFRVAEKYAVYHPLCTRKPLSTQGFLLSEASDGYLSFHMLFFLVFYITSTMRYCNLLVTVVFLGLILDQS